jgi:NADH-quinone oxidoreductase subunit M
VILSLLVLLPLIGAALILAAPGRMTKPIALAATALTLIPCALLVSAFDSTTPAMQFVETYAWIPSFGIQYYVGVDGLSFPLVVLTVLLSFLCVIASWNIEKQPKGYFALFLMLQASMTGVFAALDLFLFYVFWELMLLPMYFLIGIWGSPSRVDPDGRTRGGPYAAIKFFLYTLVGSLLMLVAILWLWTAHGTFNMTELMAPGRGLQTQVILWSLFFLAFAVKIPMFPFHTWLPDAHVEAPTAVSVILAGVLLKMGTYGILRINYAFFPGATILLADWVAVFGVINILYGALCAMAQTDMKRLVAYSSISHMGYVMLGMSAIVRAGTGAPISEAMLGGVLQMWNHGTITAMLFLLVGIIYDRAHHRDINRFGGLAVTMPVYTGFVAFAFFASLGLPGLSGFIGEALVLLGSWKVGGVYRTFVALAAVGIVITAAYHLWLIHRAFLGEENPACKKYPDISPREIFSLAPLVVIILWIGVYPAPMLNVLNATLERLTLLVIEGSRMGL